MKLSDLNRFVGLPVEAQTFGGRTLVGVLSIRRVRVAGRARAQVFVDLEWVVSSLGEPLFDVETQLFCRTRLRPAALRSVRKI